ncbi:hypothetical protein ACR9GP_25705 [Enterobacter ludwigii]
MQELKPAFGWQKVPFQLGDEADMGRDTTDILLYIYRQKALVAVQKASLKSGLNRAGSGWARIYQVQAAKSL